MTTMRSVKRMCVAAVVACSILLSISASGFAGQGSPDPPQQNGSGSTAPAQAGAPSSARDPNADSDGYEYTAMPGREQADRMVIGKLVGDQIESASQHEGTGLAWDVYASYGRDEHSCGYEAKAASSTAKRTTRPVRKGCGGAH